MVAALTLSDYLGRWWMMLPHRVPAASTILEAVLHHCEIASLLRFAASMYLRSKNLLRKSVDNVSDAQLQVALHRNFSDPDGD